MSHILLGIRHLRARLSKILLSQIAGELPSLIEEIKAMAHSCRHKLSQFGEARTSLMEQKTYLLKINQSFQSLVKAAIDGTYNDPFFDDAQSEVGYRKRVRAVIQNLNIGFAATIRQQSHHHQVVSTVPKRSASQVPVPILRKTFVDRVMNLMSRTRGRELPGTFNPLIVKDLFSEQCRPWTGIVNDHIQMVWKAIKDFLGHTTRAQLAAVW